MKTRVTLLGLVLLAGLAAPGYAQAPPPFVGMGDSIGEGVQSADASTRTQPNTYLNLIAQQMRVSFPLPLIASGPLSVIGNVQGRTRIDPNALASNLAVSGATVDSLLNQVAGQPIDDEADLVLEPRTGTQMQIAQSLAAPFTICWIGNGDVLSAVLAWNQLDASQITPLSQFTVDYATIATDLSSWGGKAVVGTIPDVTQIGFVFSPQDLQRFLGTDCGLPSGSYTTLPTMLLIRMGIFDCSIVQNPSYVLDPTEISTIQQATQAFNQVIKNDAAAAGLAVADIAAIFNQIQSNPPVINGLALTTHYNGGLLSLDGVHPSDTGHALAANAFIQAANQVFGMSIPLLTTTAITHIADADPFIDWNQNLVVRGRPLAGLVETLGPAFGISGDFSDQPPPPPPTKAASVAKIDKAAGQAFMRQYFTLKGLPASTPWGVQDAVRAMNEIFGFWH